MRVGLVEQRFSVAPGEQFDLDIDVFNTAEVIDGVTAHVLGLDPAAVTSSPSQLSLFPQSGGRMRLAVRVPTAFPAGRHDLRLEIRSSLPGGPVVEEIIELEVGRLAAATVSLRPDQVNRRRKGAFAVAAQNTGNITQTLSLSAVDRVGVLRFTFAEPVLELLPGATGLTEVEVRARRRFFGADNTYPFSVEATDVGPNRIDPALDATEPPKIATTGTFVQRPIIARGIITALLLAAIIAAWALAMLFGFTRVMARDPLPKSAPISFFASSPELTSLSAAPGTTATTKPGAAKPGAAPPAAVVVVATPPGALPKTGGAHGIGGSVKGKVTVATAPDKGIGRITVQAIHVDRDNTPQIIGSAATDEDGLYTIDSLLPGRYKLHFTGAGYQEIWYPQAPDIGTATDVPVTSLDEKVIPEPVVIAGKPGTITGVVDTGIVRTGAETDPVVPVDVSYKRSDGKPLAAPAPPVRADADGNFTLANVPAPGDYLVAVEAPGYEPASVPVHLDAGQGENGQTPLIMNKIRLQAGVGTISGTVTDGKDPLGGVDVQVTSGDLTLKTATPTVGTVGQFSLPNLPTPGTYLLTFTKEGFGPRTVDVALGPGESAPPLEVLLAGGTGTISGTVTDPAGNGVGDVTVTINGGASSLVTHSLTGDGREGFYTVSGLAAPGTYTVTVTAPGYVGATIGVVLGVTGAVTGRDIQIAKSVGTLRGTVRGLNNVNVTAGLPGVLVSVTDGATIRTALTVSDPAGTYVLPGVEAGTYAVTFSLAGYEDYTVLVQVKAAEDTVTDIVLTKKAV